MPNYEIPYGKGTLAFDLPDSYRVTLLAPTAVPPAPDPKQVVVRALSNPVGGFDWARWRGVSSAAIAVNDKTRPVPHEHLLPPLLQRLAQLGLRPQDIQFLIATGTHSVMPPAEYPLILPQEIVESYPITCHDATDEAGLAYVGQTRRGTPVWMNRRFLEADLRVAVGNAEPHQIVGFSGGVKSAVIGLAGKATIQRNHALMAEPGVEPGRYHDNPARQDLEEMGSLVGVHLALNGVLNADKQIVHAVAGEPMAVMATAIPLVRSVYQLEVDGALDLLIVSPGGHPKDINVYQAQKALAHAAPVSRAGGTIILAAACPEGAGSQSYEDWVTGMGSHEAVIERFRREAFAIGPHKAFQIARDTIGRRVLWVTDMPPALMQRLLLAQAASLSQALARVLPELPEGARVGIMPVANATVASIRAAHRAAGPGPRAPLTA